MSDKTSKATKSDSPVIVASSSYTPSELAEIAGCDPKSFRRHIRRMTSARAGRGGAWSIKGDDAMRLLDTFKSGHGRVTTFAFADDVSVGDDGEVTVSDHVIA